MRGHYHLYSSHTLDISEKNSNTRLFIYISVLFRKPVLIKACQGHFNSNTICHSQRQNKNHRLSTCECCFKSHRSEGDTVQDVSTSTFANSVHLYLLLLQCRETFSALRSKVNICYHAPDSRTHVKNWHRFHRQISLHFCQLLPACQSWAMVTNIFF